MSPLVKSHGVYLNLANGRPAKVINVSSKKRKNEKIKLDSLFRLKNPQICVRRRLGGIGDVIMSTPLCAAIKRLIPHCTLTYATDMTYMNRALGEAAEHCPSIDHVVSALEIKEENFDYLVDITSTGLNREKAGMIPPSRIDMFAEEAGISVKDNPVPIYVIRDEEREKLSREIKTYIGDSKRKDVTIIAVQAKSNDARRTWPLDYTEKLIAKLAENANFRILILDWDKGVERWKQSKNIFPVINRTMADTAVLLEQADIVVCPGSAILHLAAALNKRIVTIFGPIPAKNRVRHYTNATAIQLNLPCSGCCYTPRCMHKVGAGGPNKLECLTGISVDMVYDAIIKKLNEEEKPRANLQYGKDNSVGGQDDIILVKETTSDINNVLSLITATEGLRGKYPGRDIHLAIPKDIHHILEYCPSIDKLLDTKSSINSKRYYLTADLSGLCHRYETNRASLGKEIQKNRTEILSEALGTRNFITDILPRYYISPEELLEAKAFLKKLRSKKPILFLSLKSEQKQCSYPYKLRRSLATKLAKHFKILDPTGENNGEAIDISDMSFRQQMAVLYLCDRVVAVDNSHLHVSAALKVPSISIFGPTSYKARCKGYKNTIVIATDFDCSPCWRSIDSNCQHNTDDKSLSKCLSSITPEQIIGTIKKKIIPRSIQQDPIEYKIKPLCVPFNYKYQPGLGDIFREWLRPGNWPNILEPLSKQRKINLLVCSHNKNAIDFFKYIDFIDVHTIQWENRTPDYKQIAKELGADLLSLKERHYLSGKVAQVPMEIYLSPEEKKLYKKITSMPYVIIHPFAGEKSRVVLPPSGYIPLIDLFIDKYRKNVVVIGSNYVRGKRLKSIPSCKIDENFSYKRPGLYNLVNRTSTRLAAKLTTSAQYMLGTWSAFACAAWETKIPSIIFIDKKTEQFMIHRTKDRWYKGLRYVIVKDVKTAQSEALYLYESTK